MLSGVITPSPYHFITPYSVSRPSFTEALRAACVSGSAASITSTIALAACGEWENGSAAGPINGPSQWLWGEDEAYTLQATWRHTATGFVIHHASSVMWASVYERVFGSSEQKRPVRICAEAAALTALAYVVDYHVTPGRFRPGFEKHLGPQSIFAVYAAFGAGLAIASLMRQASRSREPDHVGSGGLEPGQALCSPAAC